MMSRLTISSVSLALVLATAGCAASVQEPMRPMPGQGSCDAAQVQGQTGKVATAELGARLRDQTGAATLRWIPPDSAVTMDFRADRLNIEYDRDYRITRIRCG